MAASRSRTAPRRAAPRPRAHAPAPAGELRDGFRFRGGRIALDLTASLVGRKRAQPTDLLGTPADLARWLAAAGLGPVTPPPEPADLAAAHELREAIYRLVVDRIHHRSLAAADRSVVNRRAAQPAPAPQLTADGGQAWIGTDAPTLLAAVARDAVALVGGEEAERLRICAACPIVFLDTSRAGVRRWCSMLACGNRAKVREFRERAGSDG